MDNTKEDLLSKLYVLRAGLSYLAVKKDEAEELKEQIGGLDAEKREEKEAAIEEEWASSAYATMKKPFLNTEEYSGYLRYNDAQKEKSVALATLAKRNGATSGAWLVVAVVMLTLVALACLAVMVNMSIIFVKNFVDSYPITGLLAVFGVDASGWDQDHLFFLSIAMFLVILGVGGGAVGLVRASVSIGTAAAKKNAEYAAEKKNQKNAKKTYEWATRVMLEEEENARTIKKWEEEYAAKLQEEKENCSRRVDEIEEEIEEKYDDLENEYNGSLKDVLDEAKAFLEMLQDTYGDIIDRRDWENLDAIIYYLETNRADTMKEALRSIDHDRRFEGFGDLLVQATRSLQATITNCATATANMLEKGFSTLSQKMEENASLIRRQNIQMDRIAEQNRSLYLQNQQVMSLVQRTVEGNQQMLKSAMEQKSGVSSADLCKAVDYYFYRERVR